MILKAVFDFIDTNNLIQKGDKILVGLSGGADSVCLTHILYSLRDELGIEVLAAHINHGIRGDEAKRDEAFVKKFTDKYKIPLFVKHADVPYESKKRGISEELCGREIRYEFFEEILKNNSINKIATAHNKNDNAETILMNFIRGTSISGLCGIPVRRENIIRPILSLTRDEIIDYITENSLDYVTDSTNFEDEYTRNKIRLKLMPEIQKEYNPSFVGNVVKNAINFNVDKELLESITDESMKKCVIGNTVMLDLIKNEHKAIQRRILYKLLKSRLSNSDISSVYIDELEKLIYGQSGKRIALPENIEAIREYDKLILRNRTLEEKNETHSFKYRLEIGKTIKIKELNAEFLVELTDKNSKYAFTVPEKAELIIRSRREGDYFYPEGMTGRKKLKKYFSDEKIPLDERNKTGILTVNGEIAYIIGKRRDRRFTFSGKGIKLIIK